MKARETLVIKAGRELLRDMARDDRPQLAPDGKSPAWVRYTLEELGYVWSTRLHKWHNRQYGELKQSNGSIVKESSFVLIRVMSTKKILERDRDNYALAFEAIGYEVVDISAPRENRENGFFRLYIKAKA